MVYLFSSYFWMMTDYYEVVKQPMDMGKLLKRCSACRYRSVEGFKKDLALVASNCHLYCQDKFPTLPPAADAVVKVKPIIARVIHR